jgi:predicted transcriptional regulator
MNEKDYKAFREWIETEFDFDESINGNIAYLYEKSIFRFACEYKQKEIEDLYKHLKHEHDLYRKHLKVYEDEILEYKEAARSEAEEVNRLQDETKKLRSENSGILITSNSGILITSKINERIDYLQAENKKLREALESIAKDYDRPSDMMKKAREALKEIKE